jgi:hypothetical protein
MLTAENIVSRYGRIEVLPAAPHGTIVRIHIPQGIEA